MLRTKAGFTQAQLAEKLNCSYNFISYIENGKKRASVEFYIMAANLFQVSLDTIFKGSVKINKNVTIDTALIKLSYMDQQQQELALKIIDDIIETLNK